MYCVTHDDLTPPSDPQCDSVIRGANSITVCDLAISWYCCLYPPMKTYDHPFAIDKIVLNIRADFLKQGIIERDGGILDMKAFKIALVSSIKKPITIGPGEDIRAKLAEGHDMLTQIRCFVVMKRGRPVRSGFRKSKIEIKRADTLIEYLIRRSDDHDVQIVGEPALTPAQQRDVFAALARDLAQVQIFDDESPVVADALRDMLERR